MSMKVARSSMIQGVRSLDPEGMATKRWGQVIWPLESRNLRLEALLLGFHEVRARGAEIFRQRRRHQHRRVDAEADADGEREREVVQRGAAEEVDRQHHHLRAAVGD